MKLRVVAPSALALAGLLALAAQAQGLRPPQGTGLGRAAAAPAAPLPSAPAPGTLRSADYIVAVVNSEPVTNNEVRIRAARIAQQLGQQGTPLPPQDVLLREVLERLIVERIQLQQAREAGIRVDDYALGQAEQGIARQNNMTLETLYARLERDGLSRERFREEVRNQLLLQRVREREVEARVRVSDLDIDQYLRELQEAAQNRPAEINLGHVLVIVPENAPPARVAELEARAKRAAEKARAGDDFAAVAREFSEGAEARNAGGQLGLRPTDRYPELFVDATRGQPLGSIVGPIRSPAGFHVLKVIERVTPGLPSTVVQQQARHILLRTTPQLSEAAAAARLADFRRRVTSGTADFAALAREYSQDGSAKQGGDLGWAGPGRYVPEFEQALNALKPGEISEPVVSRFGVHLIQLVDRREAAPTQRELRDMARDTVREKKLDEAFATWVQEQRARAYVEYREPPQ